MDQPEKSTMGSKLQTILLLVLTVVLTANLLITVPLLQQTSSTLDKILAHLRATPDLPAVAYTDPASADPHSDTIPPPPTSPTTPDGPDHNTVAPSPPDRTTPPTDVSAGPDPRVAAADPPPVRPTPPTRTDSRPTPPADPDPVRTTPPDPRGDADPDPVTTDPPARPDTTDAEPDPDPDPQADRIAAAIAAAEKRKADEAAARRARIWADYGPTVTRIMQDLLDAPAKTTQQRYSPRYARDVPLETTSQFLAQLRADYGRFQSLTSYEVIPSLEPGIHAFKTRAKADNGELSMTVTLNARKEIVGIYAQ